jgi:hypothetical protein
MALALSAPVSIPFTTTSDGLVLIPATLGGSVPAHLIFDTGAGIDVIAPSHLRRLHARPAGQFAAFRMWGDRVDVPLYTIDELSVGGSARKNVVVGGWDLLDTLHLDGIVSLNDFRHQPVTFDFTKNVVVLESSRSLAQRHQTGVAEALRFDDYRGIALDLFAEFRIGADSGLCSLDTGSPSATFNTRYLAPFAVDTTDSTVRRSDSKNAGGASGVRYSTRVPQWSLATSPLVTADHPRVTFANIIYDCVAGIDFWAGRAVTFDIPGRTLIVSRGKSSG